MARWNMNVAQRIGNSVLLTTLNSDVAYKERVPPVTTIRNISLLE